jgi:hypothetical protein
MAPRGQRVSGEARRVSSSSGDASCELGRPQVVRWLCLVAHTALPPGGQKDRERLRAEQALRLDAQELRAAGADPPRRRSEPASRNTFATVVCETLIPTPFNSPWIRM